MSALEALIRVHRWQLDERRRYLAGLESLAEKLRIDAQRLHEEAEAEARAAGLSTQASAAYPSFVRALIERRRRLERSIDDVEKQIGEARQAIAAAFQEVKRYEIAVANRARDNRERLSRRQQGEQDAMAIEIYRRRNGD